MRPRSPRRARLELSLLAEPGDPRLVAALEVLAPDELLRAVDAGAVPSGLRAWPRAWTERIRDLSRTSDQARRHAAAAGMRWVCPGEPGWPEHLGDLDHVEPVSGATGTPLGLWVRGTPPLARMVASSVAIVGARDATTYGGETASDLAADVADAGTTVISGGAFGIDACAHRGALALGGPTVAVLAGGADVDYPRAHAALLRRIAADGLVVSEQAPGATPTKNRFLSRNRLIAALARGTVVVEAARRSGSLNTLHWADQLGRVTMGVPGPVTSQASAGVHQAIRDGKAIVVTNGAEVLESLGDLGVATEPPIAAETSYDRLPRALQRAIDGVSWSSPRTAEELAAALHEPVKAVDASLRALAAAGFVARVPTGWLLVRRADLSRGADRPTVTGWAAPRTS